MSAPLSPPARIRVVTLHLTALLLGLAGTGLSLLQGRYWLAHPANAWLLILIACIPLIAAVAFAIGPHHSMEDRSDLRPVRSWLVWGNLAMPVLLTSVTVILVAMSGSFEHFAGFAMLIAANAGRNLRDMIHHLWYAF